MPYASSNGAKIYYEEVGQGTPLLLLGDKGWEFHIWEPLLPYLKAQFRLIIPELRGSGRSSLGEAPLTVELFMEDTAFLLELLNLYDLPVLGVGLGGKVAQLLAGTFPERVSALMLCNTSQGGVEGELYGSESLKNLFLLGSDAPEEVIEAIAQKAVHPAADGRAASWLSTYIKDHFPRKAVYQEQLLAEAGCDLTEMLRKIKPRVLLIRGREDQLADPQVLERFRWMIPGGHLEIVEGGHLCLLTHPKASSEAMLKWLEGQWA